MAVIDKFVILSLCFIAGTLAELCYEYDSDDWLFDNRRRSFYCSTGCCGTSYNRYCCWDGNTGTIVGIVLGCLAGVGGLITVIVIVCCCCRRGRGAQGTVMNPVGGTTVTTATVGQTYPVNTPTYPGAYPYGQPNQNQTTGFAQPYPQQPYPQQPAPFEGPKPPPYSDVQ